jgi:hypothetical protein
LAEKTTKLPARVRKQEKEFEKRNWTSLFELVHAAHEEVGELICKEEMNAVSAGALRAISSSLMAARAYLLEQFETRKKRR